MIENQTFRAVMPSTAFIKWQDQILPKIELNDASIRSHSGRFDGENSSILASGAWISTFTDHPIRSRQYVGWNR